MPPRRKRCLTERGQRDRNAADKKQRRDLATEEQTQNRLVSDRVNHATRISLETQEQTNSRLAAAREDTSARRAIETPDQTASRLVTDRVNHASRIALETQEQTNSRLAAAREDTAARIVLETQVQTVNRLAAARVNTAARTALETQVQTINRLAAAREDTAARIATETPEQTTVRLAAMRNNNANVRLEETEEARERRLTWQRDYQRNRRANMTDEQREIQRANDRERYRNRRVDVHQDFRIGLPLNVIDNMVELHYCGLMDKVCRHCGSFNFEGEITDGDRDQFKNCCHKGRVRLQELGQTPDFLRRLYLENDLDCREFRKNIVRYNASLAFASRQANLAAPNGRGPPAMIVHGQVYHRLGGMIPEDNRQPRYCQLYILDSAEANLQRMGDRLNAVFDPVVMANLDQFIREVNPYVAGYQKVHDMYTELVESARARGEEIQVPSMYLCHVRNEDERRYNDPVGMNQIAAVFVGEDGLPPVMSVRIYPRTGGFKNLHDCNINRDPMVYPLFFPYGEPGVNIRLPYVSVNGRPVTGHVTHLQHYQYRIAQRGGFSAIHSAQKLYLTYLLDAFLSVEGNRLRFLRENQQQLRVENYHELHDFMQVQRANPAEITPIPGRAIILPSTHIGGIRYMKAQYNDAMAIVAKYGKPDLFLTFTCNAFWREITENLGPGQKTDYRPDLEARVFRLKLKDLLHDIEHRHIFGVPIAVIHVIEFQKRGHPHAHMLITFRPEDKLRTPELIDRMISAELPSRLQNPKLYDIVVKNMLHGPCGDDNPDALCMKIRNGIKSCSKHFPKRFQPETLAGDNLKFPLYSRRDNGRFYEKRINNGRRKDMDNRWVVPYNPYLLLKYDAHINVEYCASLQSVKYLYKYVYKGHDRANIQISHDEIQDHMDTRYVSPQEASWRLFEYPVQAKSHTIVVMNIHLPEQQPVTFRVGLEEEALDAAEQKDSKLTGWFKLNQRDIQARQHLYCQIGLHYVWNELDRKWTKRQLRLNLTIPRLPTVSVRDKELYFLRKLLLHVRGATSFEHLRTVDGLQHNTFFEACVALNLVADDRQWIDTMNEGVMLQLPSQLRLLFVHILAYCDVENKLQLWNTFKTHLCEDFTRNNELLTEQAACNLALHEIMVLLKGCSSSVEQCGLPIPEPITEVERAQFVLIGEQLFCREEEQDLDRVMSVQLNIEQRPTYESITQALDTRTQRCIFVDGPGGSGKSFLFTALCHLVRSRGEIIVPIAWSGIAAALLPGGQTCHSRFGLSVPFDREKSLSNISGQSPEANYLRSASVILVDEAAMAPGLFLVEVDRLLRELMRNNLLFGGKSVVMGGDFRQILAVIPRATRDEIVNESIKRCVLWPNFQQIELTINMRADAGQLEFKELLSNMGNGTMENFPEFHQDCVKLPAECIIRGPLDLNGNPTVGNLEHLIDHTFGNSINEHDTLNRAILTPLNVDAIDVNETILSRVESPMQTFRSIDWTDDVDAVRAEEVDNYPEDFLHTITPNGMPKHELNLKIGAIVMLMRNMSIRNGLCNGTRLRVHSMSRNLIVCYVLSSGRRVLLSRLTSKSSDSGFPFTLRRLQFPLRLSYCMTINKSQGQTLDKVGLFLPNPVFSHGQLYVAFSRVRSMSCIRVLALNTFVQGLLSGPVDVFTHNVVYTEVLQAETARHLQRANQSLAITTPSTTSGNMRTSDVGRLSSRFSLIAVNPPGTGSDQAV